MLNAINNVNEFTFTEGHHVLFNSPTDCISQPFLSISNVGSLKSVANVGNFYQSTLIKVLLDLFHKQNPTACRYLTSLHNNIKQLY